METKTIMAAFFAFLMVASVFGIALDYVTNQNRKLVYGNYTFIPTNQGFTTTINDKQYLFDTFPGDLETIEVPLAAKQLLQSPVLTITYDPSEPDAPLYSEVQYLFEQSLQDTKTIQRALFNSSDTDLAQKTCKDATASQPVIELHSTNSTAITVQNSCITITASSPADLYREVQRLTYSALGVMS